MGIEVEDCQEGSGWTQQTCELMEKIDHRTQSASGLNMHNGMDGWISKVTDELTGEKKGIYNRIMKVVDKEERQQLPAL